MRTLISWLLMMGVTYTVTAQTTTYVNAGIVESDLVTTIFGKTKQALLADNLKISPLEAKSFEAAFLEYETEKGPWLAERIALLRMYNEEFTSLDNAKLNTLTKQLINNDLEFGRLQMRYFRKMNKVLGATRAAKFFQLDHYIEQATRLYIQQQLPFIKELESDKEGFTTRLKSLTSR